MSQMPANSDVRTDAGFRAAARERAHAALYPAHRARLRAAILFGLIEGVYAGFHLDNIYLVIAGALGVGLIVSALIALTRSTAGYVLMLCGFLAAGLFKAYVLTLVIIFLTKHPSALNEYVFFIAGWVAMYGWESWLTVRFLKMRKKLLAGGGLRPAAAPLARPNVPDTGAHWDAPDA
ncbi:MAG: hypothetical protein ACREJ2_16170 [Planctomycetota bacterium]